MIILGSSSPRRKEILSYFDIPFEIRSPDCDEDLFEKKGDPSKLVATIAEAKAKSFNISDRLILTADTLVEKSGVIYGKPHCDEAALVMLKNLNGSWHTVHTALCARLGDKLVTRQAQTHILFHNLTASQLQAYARSYHGKDKAGGYGVQEGGAILVKKIDGCFYNVLGLPVHPLCQILSEFGIDLWQHLKPHAV